FGSFERAAARFRFFLKEPRSSRTFVGLRIPGISSLQTSESDAVDIKKRWGPGLRRGPEKGLRGLSRSRAPKPSILDHAFPRVTGAAQTLEIVRVIRPAACLRDDVIHLRSGRAPAGPANRIPE